jgi:hypothetical protein
MPSQQLQGQLQTQHSLDTSIYIMGEHNSNNTNNNNSAEGKIILIQKGNKQTK